MKTKEQPAFKQRYKCVVGTKPKLKKDNLVIRPENGALIVERVTSGKTQRRVKQPWPQDLVLVVRGNVSLDIADFVNTVAEV